jgi:hypothetical protein
VNRGGFVSLFTFAQRKDDRVRSFLLKLMNTHCPGLTALAEGPRLDRRVNLVMVVTVIPIEGGKLQVHDAFAAVTKDFSITGVAVVLDQPRRLEQAVLGFRLEGETTFILARAKHLDPMGGGYFQLGFKLTEVVSPADYPGLESAPTPFSESSRSSRGS